LATRTASPIERVTRARVANPPIGADPLHPLAVGELRDVLCGWVKVPKVKGRILVHAHHSSMSSNGTTRGAPSCS